MTIAATASEISYAGNGVTLVFAVPFPFDTSADLKVILTDSSGNPVVLASGFSTGGGGGSTGTLTMVTAPPVGSTLTILDDPDLTQTADYTDNDAFPAATHEGALDRGVRISKRLYQLLLKCIRVDDGDPIAGGGTLLGSVQARKGKYLFFNAITGAIEYATALIGSTISQSIIGQFLYPQTTAEASAGVTPTNLWYPECYVDRYGTNTTPGTTDMAAATLAAINVANAKGNGGAVYFVPGATYKWGSALTFPLTSKRIHMYGQGAYISVTHNGNGINWIVTNENYSGHSISDLTITGPNPLAYSPAVWTSTGAGISMDRLATTNAVTAYNNVLRNVTVQGFSTGLLLQAVINLNVFGCVCQFNQYGLYIDGGQTNANHFFGLHVRYNRKAGIFSAGTSGGSLSNATKNAFYGALIESNVPDPGASGGTPPSDSVGIYLNNSYNFEFYGCYSENHSASIYLTGSSKHNKFMDHRIGSGTGRLDAIYLIGGGIYSNRFVAHADSLTLTEVNVISDNANQLYNDFNGSTGLNFVSGSVLGNFEHADIKPSLNFTNDKGYGLVKLPQQGYATNVSSGTTPGCINGIGTGAATLNATGLGEINIGNGITGATSITTVSGLTPNSLFILRSTQGAFAVTLKAAAFGNAGGQDVIFNTGSQVITYWVNGDGVPREIGRNFSGAGVYTVTNGSIDRALNVTADTTAQVAAVLGTLIGDLQGRGIIN